MSDFFPAFPVQSNYASMNNKDGTQTVLVGMSLRDYFAAAALPTFLANDETTFEEDVDAAYMVADKMLAKRVE